MGTVLRIRYRTPPPRPWPAGGLSFLRPPGRSVSYGKADGERGRDDQQVDDSDGVGDYPGQAQVDESEDKSHPAPLPWCRADWRVAPAEATPTENMPKNTPISTHVPSTSGLIRGAKMMSVASAVLRRRATTLPPISSCLSVNSVLAAGAFPMGQKQSQSVRGYLEEEEIDSCQ